MRQSAESLIELIEFAGVAVAFLGVVVAVVRAAMASLVGDRSRRMTTISLDLARTVLIGLDLLLVSAALDVAVTVTRPDFTRLATVAGLRIGLTLLVSFELAFRAGTGQDGGADLRARSAPPWEMALRRRLGAGTFGAGSPRRRPDTAARPRNRARPAQPRPRTRPAGAERPVENLWPERARLGRG